MSLVSKKNTIFHAMIVGKYEYLLDLLVTASNSYHQPPGTI